MGAEAKAQGGTSGKPPGGPSAAERGVDRRSRARGGRRASTAPPIEGAPASAGQRLGRFAWVGAFLLGDLWSKSAVFAWLGGGGASLVPDDHGHLRHPILGEWFAFFLSYNPGMAWGVTALPPWLLVGGRVAASVFLAWLLFKHPRGRPVLGAALVLILAGALGNLHDNLLLEPRSVGARFGEVRDFIDVYFTGFDWHFPTFNVADACITVGAALLFGVSLLAREPAPPRRARRVPRPLTAARAGLAPPRGLVAAARGGHSVTPWPTSPSPSAPSACATRSSRPRGPSGTGSRCATSRPPRGWAGSSARPSPCGPATGTRTRASARPRRAS